jgi:hypothetical protein
MKARLCAPLAWLWLGGCGREYGRCSTATSNSACENGQEYETHRLKEVVVVSVIDRKGWAVFTILNRWLFYGPKDHHLLFEFYVIAMSRSELVVTVNTVARRKDAVKRNEPPHCHEQCFKANAINIAYICVKSIALSVALRLLFSLPRKRTCYRVSTFDSILCNIYLRAS